MGGVAFELPADVADVRDGVLRFVETEIAPRIDRGPCATRRTSGAYTTKAGAIHLKCEG